MVSTINDIEINFFLREVLTYVHLVCCNGNYMETGVYQY